MATDTMIQIQSNGHTFAADRGLSGVAVDPVQGMRPQQHYQLFD